MGVVGLYGHGGRGPDVDGRRAVRVRGGQVDVHRDVVGGAPVVHGNGAAKDQHGAARRAAAALGGERPCRGAQVRSHGAAQEAATVAARPGRVVVDSGAPGQGGRDGRFHVHGREVGGREAGGRLPGARVRRCRGTTCGDKTPGPYYVSCIGSGRPGRREEEEESGVGSRESRKFGSQPSGSSGIY